MSEPTQITESDLFAELERLREDPYKSRRKEWTPEMDELLIKARTPDADGRVVIISKLCEFFKTHYGIRSDNTIKTRMRELEKEGRL
jgi:hypothetical protein